METSKELRSESLNLNERRASLMSESESKHRSKRKNEDAMSSGEKRRRETR